ncbi:MAG TPA: prephenate dehydratase [Candidatus Omnitrophota bacterium]|nr:prephenate dehydratase [Candidatus Omnitrophota bacterium]HRZ15069.1 prephenate dehydratase [Candidatus Omnitrophota bacterium]
MSLEKLRKQVDLTDTRIVRLLNQRANIILKVAHQKLRSGKSIYVPERERQVLEKIAAVNGGPLPAEALQAIYREIMSSSLALEKPLQIAYLGPESTFTHQAALKRFGSQVRYLPCDNITDIFTEVEKNNADYGVVPIENSIEGAVNHTLDMFVDSDLNICAQVVLDISQNLLSRHDKNAIRTIYSMPQVFGQCRLWLQRNMPSVELIEVSSTSRAAQIAARQQKSAAIASLLAAKLYHLRVVARSIEDSPHNITRFLVIGKTVAGRTGKDKTSLLFSIRDKVGALHDMLVPFKKHHVNLSKIESRPFKKKAWEYYFFVDLEGHKDEPRVRKAIEELEKNCTFLKILGSYPIGE